jgi:hypothetical protein
MKLHIRSHPIAGWNEIRRAGRAWPVKGTDVEVVDEDLDPPAEPGDKVLRIGRNTLEALKGDPRITINAAGSVDEIPRLKARIAELEAQLGATKDKGEKTTVGTTTGHAPGLATDKPHAGVGADQLTVEAPDRAAGAETLSPHLRKPEDEDATLADSPSGREKARSRK